MMSERNRCMIVSRCRVVDNAFAKYNASRGDTMEIGGGLMLVLSK